jgi:uncharacterized protein YggE
MKRFKELLTVATLALLLIAGITVIALPRSESQAAPSSTGQEPPRTITVVGTGKVSLVPDIAQVNVGAEARADSVSEAKAEVDRQMVAINAALEEMGIDEKDIQTSHYSIHYERELGPVMPEGPMVEGQEGYRVSNIVRVTVRNVEKAGDVVDAAVEAGANQVHGVSFTVSDESRWQAQAREKAMADAEARAAELAGLAGVELGAVQSVSEVIGGWPAAMAPMPETVMSGGFAPGELELSTRVQVAFAIQ